MRQPRQKSSNFVDESKASVREELKVADVRVFGGKMHIS
jgi:hypothetical protein